MGFKRVRVALGFVLALSALSAGSGPARAQELEHLVGRLSCDKVSQACVLEITTGMKHKERLRLLREVDGKPWFDADAETSYGRTSVDVAGRRAEHEFYVLSVSFAKIEHRFLDRGQEEQ